ncbi:hypothetical protein HPP92_011678 [Vanilla planifolia]|uniref:E3 ubiquitin-protein ligase listerin n=1 Tax=Vanilla planifolia TaxID=51239 RepID=A0A835V189_VANPL|nr:hypothetical protein HPP92_011678 [Vanilla planifolia]
MHALVVAFNGDPADLVTLDTRAGVTTLGRAGFGDVKEVGEGNEATGSCGEGVGVDSKIPKFTALVLKILNYLTLINRVMGRQKGEGGRGKNRASSSSFAASLVPAGVSSVGFGGYLGSSRIEHSSTAEESPSNLGVDSELAQHLKRLGRKDPTTKVKALMALCVLFKEKPGEEIVHILPLWVYEYKRLLLDYNREVRQATHDTMTSIVAVVRKGLAPHLKSLMGPWWFAQFDPVPEVSQAARFSLEAAFVTSERRLDALILYVNEIFSYLDENLKLTPHAMSEKATPADEIEDMHQRVISSSLLAISTLIDILLGKKLETTSEDMNHEQKLASKL